MTDSPRLEDTLIDSVAGARDEPAVPSIAEIDTVVRALRNRGVKAVAFGHSRHASACDAANRFEATWTEQGEELRIMDWPTKAASWLRPAQRLTGDFADAWVLTGDPASLAQMIRRLVFSTPWSPSRTIGFASLLHPKLPLLSGLGMLDGAVAVSADGRMWRIEGEQPLPITLTEGHP